MEKTVEDSIKGGLIITPTMTGIFYVLKVTNVKPPKAFLDAMDIMKLADGIVGDVLAKDYAFYKKMDQRVMQQTFNYTTPNADLF